MCSKCQNTLFPKKILISIKTQIFQIVPIRPKHRKKSKRRRRKKSPSKSMRYPETDDEIDGGYWHLLSLLDNVPNYLVGCVIQKRIPIILLQSLKYSTSLRRTKPPKSPTKWAKKKKKLRKSQALTDSFDTPKPEDFDKM